MNIEQLNSEQLIKTWSQALSTQREHVLIEHLNVKVFMYQQWKQDYLEAVVKLQPASSSPGLLSTTINSLYELWNEQLERVLGLDRELKIQGNKLRVKSFKTPSDDLMQQLLLVILTLKERHDIISRHDQLITLMSQQFMQQINELHTARFPKSSSLQEILQLLKKEYEAFPRFLDFKLIQVAEEQAEILSFVPRPLLNLIFTQGLQSARFLLRAGLPMGMTALDWDTALAACLLQDVGLTSGWGIGTPRQNFLKGKQAEQQLERHADLGAALIRNLKPFKGLTRLIGDHHLPLTAMQLKARSRLTTLDQLSVSYRLIIKCVHLLYRPVTLGQQLDFMPGLSVIQQMHRMLKQEAVLAPVQVTNLKRVLEESEDQLLYQHLDRLLPKTTQQVLPAHTRIDTAHEIAGELEQRTLSTPEKIPINILEQQSLEYRAAG